MGTFAVVVAFTRRLSGVLALFAVVALWSAAYGDEAPKVSKSAGEFLSGGKTIKVSTYTPEAKGQYPAVLVLRGMDGLDTGDGSYATVLKRLAEKGYVVLIVRYFDRTGSGAQDKEMIATGFQHYLAGKDSVELTKVKKLFVEWTAVVADAAAYARKQPQVDGARLGLCGFSLGGFVALAAAADSNLKVTAVVEFFGGLPHELHGDLKSLPPVLIIHGDKDQVVPVKEATDLQTLLQAKKLPFEVQIYKDLGHMFQGTGGSLELKTALDAEGRTWAFLEKYLKAQAGGK